MQESPGLKPDWFWDIKSFSMKNENISLYNNLSRTSPHIWKRETGLYFFIDRLSFFMNRGNVGFFPTQGESPLI